MTIRDEMIAAPLEKRNAELEAANQKLRETGQALLDVIDERKEKRGIWEIPECELQCDALRKVIADTQKELDKMAYDQQLEDTERQIQELRQRIAQLKAQRQTLAEALRKAIADHRNASQSDTQAGKETK